MRSKFLLLLALSATMQVGSCTASDRVVNSETPTAMLERFLVILPGQYQNSQQMAAQRKYLSANRIPAQRLFIQLIDAPEFGEHVFYAEWQSATNASDVLRQRIYAVTAVDQQLQIDLHIFPSDEVFKAKTAGAYLDTDKLRGVTPKDMVPLPGCEIFLQAQAQAFVGAMRKHSCKFPAPGTGEPIYSWTQMRISATTFEYQDGWFNVGDDSLYSRRYADWIVFQQR